VHVLIVGGTRDERIAAAHERGGGSSRTWSLDAAPLPFVRPTREMLERGPEETALTGPRVVRIDDIEQAFPNVQIAGTRLVLTQSIYIVQKWVDLLESGDGMIVTADRAALERDAAEAFEGRGPWASFEVVDLGNTTDATDATDTKGKPLPSRAIELLVRAYGRASAEERARLCREATEIAPDDPASFLALASACRELQDMAGARAALDRAAGLAPDWEAVHYEDGKFWLGHDDMERASAAFQRAADRMPTFSSAFSNLGATLGELDQPDAALAAFRHALLHDPRSFTLLNNVGVVSRELGHLDESEAAFRRAIDLAPGFVFGYYNLGHTLFLAGKLRGALAAYEEGQRRDPEKNRRQGCRLALMRFATGDTAGAERDLWRFVDEAPADEREDLLLEAYEIAHALVAEHPELAPHRPFLDRIAAALTGPST
jgi:tetratricopeptide (TPR) repeat protein